MHYIIANQSAGCRTGEKRVLLLVQCVIHTLVTLPYRIDAVNLITEQITTNTAITHYPYELFAAHFLNSYDTRMLCMTPNLVILREKGVKRNWPP